MQPDTTMGPGLLDMSNGGTAAVTPEEGTVPPGQQEPKKSATPLQDSLRRLRRDKRAMVSLGIIVLFIVVPLIGPVIYQHVGGTYQSTLNGPISPQLYHNPFHQELDRQDEFISGQYWFGTDAIGRDLMARLMQGLLVSLTVALLVEVVDLVLGVFVGVLAG
ncbi:MAG: ABC transporter permease, partial [Chloroflexi bacterium]